MPSVRFFAETGTRIVEGAVLFGTLAPAQTVLSGPVALIAVLAVNVPAAFAGTAAG